MTNDHRCQSTRRLLIVILTALLLIGCERLHESAARRAETSEKAMSVPATTKKVLRPPPPLDQQIPVAVETATFALG